MHIISIDDSYLHKYANIRKEKYSKFVWVAHNFIELQDKNLRHVRIDDSVILHGFFITWFDLITQSNNSKMTQKFWKGYINKL